MNLQYIDALRGIAILGVVAINSSSIGPAVYPDFVQSFLNIGEYGVQSFFILSAFVLFLSLDQYRETKSIKRAFFIRRFFRIAPLYYLAIIYYLWQNHGENEFWLASEQVASSSAIASNFLFLHGLSPKWINSVVPGSWCITAEMLFYLAVPFLFSKIKNLNSAILFTLGAIVFTQGLKFIGYLYPLIAEETLWKAYLNLYLPAQLPGFGLGFIAYFSIIKKDKQISNLVLTAITFFVLTDVVWVKVIPPSVHYGVAFFLVLYSCSKYPVSILVNKPIRFIGKISYSIYLIHFGVIYWLNYFDLAYLIPTTDPSMSTLNLFLRILIVLCITIPISFISYSIIEIPMQKLGKLVVRSVKTIRISWGI